MTPEELLALVTEFYLNSDDFNGLPIPQIDGDLDDLRKILHPLVEKGLLYVNFGGRHPNPHTLAFAPEPIKEQFNKLGGPDLTGCLYRTTAHLQGVLDRGDYAGRPYTLELALGYPQLGYHFFELSTLESYRNDPGYYYKFDIGGMISIHDGHYDDSTMAAKDRILMQSFGLAFSKEKYWALMVFRRYLHALPPEYQQIWKAKQEPDDATKFQPHPDYWRSSIHGQWPEKISLFAAFIKEMEQVNELAELMGRPPLFRETYHENRPRDFGYLIRPTARELANFASVLDRMLSDNINRDFFQGDVSYEDEATDKKGRLVVTQKGSIRILEEWIKTKFKTDDDALLPQAIATLKNVRKLRNPQAQAKPGRLRHLTVRGTDSVDARKLPRSTHNQANAPEPSRDSGARRA